MKIGKLQAHPEGGEYRRVHLSEQQVITENKVNRQAMSHIYYRLPKNGISKFHKVAHDEVWNLYKGDELQLFIWDDKSEILTRNILSAKMENFCHIVPGGTWQAAKASKSDILVGCTVAPGFDFEDFQFLDLKSSTAQNILAAEPSLVELIK